MKKKHFLLTGTYSSFNKGDAAMQLATANALKNEWPNCLVTISTPFPNIDQPLYQELQVIKSTRRNLIYGTLQVVRAWLYKILHIVGLKATFLIANQELQAFHEADAIIDLSGDTITEDYGPHVTYSHLLPIMLSLAFKKPVFVCAQSIGPFKITKLFVKSVLNKTSHVTARENITYKYLKSIGIKNSILSETADMAFLLEPSSKKRLSEILTKESLSIDKTTIGITVSRIVEERYNAQGGNFTAEFAQMLDRLMKKQDIRILFIGHVTGPSEIKDDRIIAKEVSDQMRNNKHIKILQGNYRPDEVKAVLNACDVVVGSRMHSNIGALSSGVATIAIGYSHKTNGIMSLFEMSDLVCNIDDLSFTDLQKKIEYCLKNNKQVSSKLNQKLPVIKKLSRENISILKEQLHEQ